MTIFASETLKVGRTLGGTGMQIMRTIARATLLLVLCANVSAAGIFCVADGQEPWHDRAGQWHIAAMPAKYISDKALPQQSCAARTLILPGTGAKSVLVGVPVSQIGEFTTAFSMVDTGDRFFMEGRGRLEYAVVLFTRPPKSSEFTFSKAGVVLLSWDGEVPAPSNKAGEDVAADQYVVADNVCPWSDRRGQWVISAVPPQFCGGRPVPLQSCTNKTLILPEGLEDVTFGTSDTKLAEVMAQCPGSRDTGLDFVVQNPSGTGQIHYSIVVWPNPQPRLDLKSVADAGLVVLALNGANIGALVDKQVVEGVKGMLAQNQEFSAQEWTFESGERKVKMWVEEPPAGITANTGLMLVLHNWGGYYTSPEYIQWCKTFAARYNVIAVSVNYLQSASDWSDHRDRPYDHGYLQAMDCIGALYNIYTQLKAQNVVFNEHRIYSMGGSGGGNVTQMVMKLAPHTFACGVDICGMPGLTDGIAFGTGEYGSGLNAAYSKDPHSPNYLTTDMQEIRDFGNLEHCKLLHEANPDLQIVICHGVDDRSCPVVHKVTQFRNMLMAGIRVDGHFFTPAMVDGVAVKSTDHAVGDREQVTIKFADEYMKEAGKFAKQTSGDSDFTRKAVFEYPTTNGKYVIDYSAYPTIAFVPGAE